LFVFIVSENGNTLFLFDQAVLMGTIRFHSKMDEFFWFKKKHTRKNEEIFYEKNTRRD